MHKNTVFSLFKNVIRPSISNLLLEQKVPALATLTQVREVKQYNCGLKVFGPKPGTGINYKYIVHYPEDGKYTTEHLPTTRLGGRDPETGRVVEGAWGGGRKTKYRWIDFNRAGPVEQGVYREEQVIEVQYDPNRVAFIALVGTGTHLRYIIATSTIKAGDIIRSNNYIPDIPGRGVEGDGYALGALAQGTEICCVEKEPGKGAYYLIDAGQSGRILRRTPKGEVVVLINQRKGQVALSPLCSCVVGRVSNEDGKKVHIGSAMRLRWLGHRPRSGLFQLKQGYHGRKIRPPPALVTPSEVRTKVKRTIEFTSKTEGFQNRVVPVTQRLS